VEWSKKGVAVNAIAPGVFHTALNADMLDNTPRGQELLARKPMARFGRTEELVGAAVYLCSDAASFVTGQTLVVDGGFLASGGWRGGGTPEASTRISMDGLKKALTKAGISC